MIIIDTREKPHAIKKIIAEFDRQKIEYIHKKLDVGDYWNSKNPHIVIDRKQSLGELCGNLCQNKARFYKEFERGRAAGIKLIILCEHGNNIKTLSDVANWQNPRLSDSPRAITGRELMERLFRLRVAFQCDIEFCEKWETGSRIIELLGG